MSEFIVKLTRSAWIPNFKFRVKWDRLLCAHAAGQLACQPGDKVTTGQVLGLLGNSGNTDSTFPTQPNSCAFSLAACHARARNSS